jgi:hypothetical protein
VWLWNVEFALALVVISLSIAGQAQFGQVRWLHGDHGQHVGPACPVHRKFSWTSVFLYSNYLLINAHQKFYHVTNIRVISITPIEQQNQANISKIELFHTPVS